MTFIRAKEIPPRSGNWYDYEVMNYREGGKVRQKVIRYLGKSGMANATIAAIPMSDTPDMTTSAVAEDARVYKMKTPARLVASAMGMYYGGMSLDAIQQQFRQDLKVQSCLCSA